jgi:DNA-directed RNA polymerase subunit RPC12/RpoP
MAKVNFVPTVDNVSELPDPIMGDVCYNGKTTWMYTGTKWEPLEIPDNSLSGIEDVPKKIIYKSITNCTNCGGLLSWQSIYEPAVRCSYCGSILQKEEYLK